MKKLLALIVLTLLFIPLFHVSAVAPQTDQKNPVELYIFTKQGCPHCANVLALLNSLKSGAYPNLNFHDFDLLNNDTNITKFFQFTAAYNVSNQSVPVTIIGDKAFLGDSDLAGIQNAIDVCSHVSCANPQQIVDEYLITHPDAGNSNSTSGSTTTNQKTIIGLVVLGIAIVGGVVIVISRK